MSKNTSVLCRNCNHPLSSFKIWLNDKIGWSNPIPIHKPKKSKHVWEKVGKLTMRVSDVTKDFPEVCQVEGCICAKAQF